MMKRCLWLPILLLAGLIAACGGGGGDEVTGGSASSTGITTGVAVDPYIVNAQFEELSADRQTVIQRASTSSNANGEFSFTNPIADGSIIQIKTSARGQHANAPYEGIIRRQVFDGETGPVVVSPLTTLLANGMSPSAVLQMLQSAGFSGLSANDLDADPMAGLMSRTGSLTEADLTLLQANMAVHSFMVANQDFNYGGPATVASHPVAFNDIATLVKETLNPIIYQDLSLVVGSDFTVGDLAMTAATLNRTVVNQVRQEIQNGTPSVPPTTIDQYMNNALADADAVAGNVYQNRMADGGGSTPPTNNVDGQAVFTANCASCHTVGSGTGVMDLAGDGSLVNSRFSGGTNHNGQTLTADEITAIAGYFDNQGGTTDPGTGTGGGTTTPPTTTPDGQTVFTNNCAGCHTAGSGSGMMDLAADGALVNTRFGGGTNHNGQTLTADEITAVAGYLDSLGGTTDPGTGTGGGTTTPPTGDELYGMECQGCHGSLATSDVNDRTAAGIQAAIDGNVGGMGSITLTSSEVQSIADALAAATPPTTEPPVTQPPQDRTGQQAYDQECASCHALGSHDTTSTVNIDLAGLGSMIPAKVQGGHRSGSVTDGELTALATFADTFTSSGGGGTGPVTGSCDSCHGQPPAGSTFPNTAGAHAVHAALADVGSDCSTCHTGATHNDWVDLGFPATWDAQAGAALDNMDGTCSNISCHGGQQTPDWTTGSIDVASQCQSCHASGTAEPNGYFSGEHRKHVNGEGISCDTCHDPARLQNGHFDNLNTAAFEQDPAATLRSNLSYSGGTCNTVACHGSEQW